MKQKTIKLNQIVLEGERVTDLDILGWWFKTFNRQWSDYGLEYWDTEDNILFTGNYGCGDEDCQCMKKDIVVLKN